MEWNIELKQMNQAFDHMSIYIDSLIGELIVSAHGDVYTSYC
jgi:hypothetical protein